LSAEHVVYRAPPGESARFGKKIPYTYAIDEGRIVCWARCSRPGLVLAANVVLPRSLDPTTGEPLQLLIRSRKSSSEGEWKMLQLDQLRNALAAEARIARANVDNGASIDEREAYVSDVVLLAPGGKGNADARKSGLSPDRQISLESKLLARVDRIGTEPVLGAPGFLLHGDSDGLIDLQIRAGQGDVLEGLLDTTSVVLRVQVEIGHALQAGAAVIGVGDRLLPNLQVRDVDHGVVRCHDPYHAYTHPGHFAVDVAHLDLIAVAIRHLPHRNQASDQAADKVLQRETQSQAQGAEQGHHVLYGRLDE